VEPSPPLRACDCSPDVSTAWFFPLLFVSNPSSCCVFRRSKFERSDMRLGGRAKALWFTYFLTFVRALHLAVL
jgi:hypothetical protein